MRDIQTRKIDFGHLKNNELKPMLKKILNKTQEFKYFSSTKKIEYLKFKVLETVTLRKVWTIKSEFINGAQLKELNFEPSSVRQPITSQTSWIQRLTWTQLTFKSL
ncbi:MAG: hypothetical protein CM15mP98_06720 [Paracoccaceae bacterium]|nr:MAG: hypothetical protein CM15mP98_06720 [Paracoccaceae bacterium]